MSETKANRKKINPPWMLGLVVLLLLTLLVLLQTSNLWKTFSIESAGDTLLLYALSSLNFFAFVIFGFILLRNLIKLARERRALQLGAKFKTRLWLYFFAVSILPIVAMAGFSYLFMNRALERWFTSIPGDVIREAREVQNKAVNTQADRLREGAQMIAVSLDGRAVSSADLRRIAEAGNVTHLEVVSKLNKTLAVYEKTLDAERQQEVARLLALARGGQADDPVLRDGRGYDVAIVPFADGRRLLLVPDFYADENVSQMIDNSLAEFEKLKEKETTIRQIGLLTLGVLTFLLIFASSWTALYIARGLTVPIKSLAEGADEIARGKLGHRVDVFAEDELALLVESFNQMSAKLEENSAELEERRRYIETVLESLPTGVISFDAANRATTINKAAKQILRLEDGDFRGCGLAQLVAEENRLVLESLLNRARRIGHAAEQAALQREAENGSANAASLPVALTATALPGNLSRSSGVVLVIEDLSELISAQRASAWAEVARRMAHEIKNPLTPIQLSAERIAKRFAAFLAGRPSLAGGSTLSTGDLDRLTDNGQLTKIVGESTDTILREVNSLKAMVDEFSRFARLPNVRLEPGDVNEVVRQSAALFEDRGARVELNLAENLPAALVDEEQLKRVFVNLVENAVEAFDQSQTDRRVAVKTFYDRGRDLIVAEVSDNAGGIPPADFPKLFQPYFSTKGRGTGLGLAIVQRIVSEHRGRIKAVNNTERGAKFIVELPVVG